MTQSHQRSARSSARNTRLESAPRSRSPRRSAALMKGQTVDLGGAIDRGVAALLARQDERGYWRSDADMGPIGLAITLLCEDWLGALSPEDAQRGAVALQRLQSKDGGWVLHPFAKKTSLGATAVCRAALRACRVADDARSVRAAERRIRALGGYDRIRDRFLSHAEPGAMFCAMVGLLPADVLPPLTPDAAALPWSERMLDGRVHAGVPMVMYAVAAVRERLSGRSSLVPKWLRAPARMLARARLSAFIADYQNEDGSWNCAVFNTVFALVALEGVGVGPDDPMVQRGLDWLETRKRRVGRELGISIFDAEVWETSFAISALHACGVSPSEPALSRARDYLLEAQCTRQQPRCNQPKPGAPRTGGWAFQMGNDTMPDCDDTGVALAALGSQSRQSCPRPVHQAIDRATEWLRGMQNDGGGFGSYVHGMPDKPAGEPMFLERSLLPSGGDKPQGRLDDLRALGALVMNPPPEISDPATADLVGRVLWGLGECGVTAADPMVVAALEFLERDQNKNGSWWGPWNPAYVAATAFVLIGAAAVGADMASPAYSRGVAWLLSVQNTDGGWGESYESFRDPSLAGMAPSMPPLTGIVLRALSDVIGAGAGTSPIRRASQRAATYLVATQEADGAWPNNDYLFTVVPPTQYSWDLHRLYYILFGLGRFRAVSTG